MDFKECKNLLVIRPDNMGDLLMSVPAIRALKRTFGCTITVLCSAMAEEAAGMVEEIDDILIANLPWLKTDDATISFNELAVAIRQRNFDGCVLFNVYSQNPAPCMLLAYTAGIPKRAAYSRENLYGLLTHWLPDDEPYMLIRHQVTRDLHLASFLGADTNDTQMRLRQPPMATQYSFLRDLGVRGKGYFVFHAGVSEQKRQYPREYWVELGRMLWQDRRTPILLTGSNREAGFIDRLAGEIGPGCISLAGKLSLGESLSLIAHAVAMITVNSGPMHLGAVAGTPMVVLYAQTNPQHTPWQVPHRLLEFSVPESVRSQNQVIAFVNGQRYGENMPVPEPAIVIQELDMLLAGEAVSSPHLQPVHNSVP